MLYKIIRSILFCFDPEKVHDFAIFSLRAASPFRYLWSFPFRGSFPELRQTLWGLDFPNPVGLAAGFDKNAEALKIWPALGFGFMELGTLTALKQPGNERPRIFRLKKDQALVNRCGFNNDGAEEVSLRLGRKYGAKLKLPVPAGMNIGKSKLTPLDQAAGDYLRSFEWVWPFADYVVINVSSPNTPDLRLLQEKESLAAILTALKESNRAIASRRNEPVKPVLVKIAPDLSPHQVDDIIEVIASSGADGIIVCNTTVSRDFPLRSDPGLVRQTGGLSGQPLKQRSTELIRYIYRKTSGQLPVIGAGGIQTGEDAYEKILAGASLVQVYTGFIYEGPFICRRINARLRELLFNDGFRHIAEAVGAENKKPSVS